MLLLIAMALCIFMALTSSPCGVATYGPELLEPREARKQGRELPMALATDENMRNVTVPVDLTGIWWIRWTVDADDEGKYVRPDGFNMLPWNWFTYGIYNWLHLEDLVSFAGARSTYSGKSTNGTFPARISAPTGRKHQWGFSDSLAGRIAFIATKENNPHSHLDIDFENSTHAMLGGFGGVAVMDKLDEDQFIRSTLLDGGRHGPPAYRLTRIITKHGNPTKYFPKFVANMGWFNVRVWDTNSKCVRQSVYDFKSCEAIHESCKA